MVCKRVIQIAMLMSLPLVAIAEEADLTVAEGDFSALREYADVEDLSLTGERTAPLASEKPEPQAIGTYRNWLGEECLKLPEDAKMYYNWKRDFSYTGVPLLLSSFIIKSEKKAFRSARFSVNENWKTKIDNYTQFSPYAVVVGLKACGYKGRSSWDRLATSMFLSNAAMAVAVNATKYSVKEMRPDNSTRNSFPSGHTATAFVAATVLHKEYGLTRSPWFSAGGYAVAMGTGFMRVLNNRHWISDVMAGAGIGIISTEMGYFLGDLIYGNKGIMRLEKVNLTDPDHPSFFDIQMGVGLNPGHITFEYEDAAPETYEFGTSSSVGVEGAYFFNKYVGVGGMVRATTTPVKGIAFSNDEKDKFEKFNKVREMLGEPGIYHINVANNNFIDVSTDVGIYGNLPLSRHFSLGAKFLVGTRFSGGFEYKARLGYREQARDANGNLLYTFGTATPINMNSDGPIAINRTDAQPVWLFENADGTVFASNESLMPSVSRNYNYHLAEEGQSEEYSIAKVTGDTSINFVTGISLSYRYMDNFAWKLFMDYNTARSKYDYKVDLFNEEAAATVGHADKRLNLWTIGAALSINF